MFLEQLQRKRLVIEYSLKARIQPHKRVHRAHRTLHAEEFAVRHTIDDGLPGQVQTPARTNEVPDALKTAQRSLHCPL